MQRNGHQRQDAQTGRTPERTPASAQRRTETKTPHGAQWWIEAQARYGGPLIPLDRIGDPFTAMGVAMFHIGSAALDYSLIQDRHSGGPTQEQLEERYCGAETDARIAHSALHLVYSELADRHPLGLGPEIRKYCRQAHTWLTRERRKAAEALGMNPPPEEDESIAFDALDHRFNPEESAHMLS